MNETGNIQDIRAETVPLERPMNFDHENTRRELIAMRVKFGAKTPRGHACSNLIEQLDNYRTAIGEQKAHLERSIAIQMKRLKA